MAFISHVVGLSREINGQIVNLTIGGVRNYADDQLYRTATPQRFKVFVGWQVRVCSNIMLTCNGNSGVIQCLTEADVFQKAIELFTKFNPERENILTQLANLQTTRMTEQQFCNIIGRMANKRASLYWRVPFFTKGISLKLSRIRSPFTQ